MGNNELVALIAGAVTLWGTVGPKVVDYIHETRGIPKPRVNLYASLILTFVTTLSAALSAGQPFIGAVVAAGTTLFGTFGGAEIVQRSVRKPKAEKRAAEAERLDPGFYQGIAADQPYRITPPPLPDDVPPLPEDPALGVAAVSQLIKDLADGTP